MDTIAAMYSLDGQMVARHALDRMNTAACILGPSVSHVVSVGAAGLCSRHTPNSDNHTSVAALGVGEYRRLQGVAAARIDNRRELIRRLARLNASEADADSLLLLKAFVAWGPHGFSHVVGDFTVAIWDAAQRQLVCARDAVGVSPLYMRIEPRRVTVASQIRQLVAVAEQSLDVDLDYIADHLAYGIPRGNGTTTPYAGIARVLPGHVLVVNERGAHVSRYWDWEVEPRIQYTRDEDYALHFLSLFTDAVTSCMRTPGRVWADLSGGLDSSSIVCVASDAHEQAASAKPISTVSVVFDRASTSNEAEWALHVRRKYDLPEHLINGDRDHPMSGIGDLAPYWDEPHPSLVFGAIQRRYRDLLASNGGSVLLSGAGAEAVIMDKREGPVHLSDLLAAGAWRTLSSEAREWQRTMRIPFSNLLLRYAIRPWLGAPRINYGWQRTVHDWIRPDFTRRFSLRSRAQLGTMPRRFKSPADQLHYEHVGRVPGFLMRGYLEKYCDVRYPFLHRPLIELMLRLPWHVKLRADMSKRILREAMRGVLPEAIRTRTKDASFGHAVYLGIRRERKKIDALIRSSRLAELGCIAPDRLLAAAERARCGHAPDLHGLISTLSLEVWLQAAFGRTSTPVMDAFIGERP